MTPFSTVADTGFVVALLNRLDVQHEPVKTLYEQASQPILLPQTTTVMTLDQRDFRLFRPNHCPYFELLP